MSRVVISILDGGFYLEEAPTVIAGAEKQQRFSMSATSYPFKYLSNGATKRKEIVRRAGEKLLKKLKTHSAIEEALSLGEVPVYIRPGTDQSDLLPWETLWESSRNFLALNANSPIGRIARSTLSRDDGTVAFTPPLKILVVLGAAGVEAEPEWQAFKRVVESARGTRLKVEIHFLVAEDSVRQLIASEGYSVEILDDHSQLSAAIRDFEPHILHFFCHGAVGATPHLLIATYESWLGGDESKSIDLSAAQLRSLMTEGVKNNVWLVVLNCCGADQSTQEVTTLTRTVVQQGIRAAIGMRQAVRAVDACVFTEFFYKEACHEIAGAIRTPDQDVVVDWANALHEPRLALCRKYKESSMAIEEAAKGLSEWTAPVLYKSCPAFRIRVSSNVNLTTSVAAADGVTIDVLSEYRKTMENIPGVLPGALADIDREIAGLATKLYPSRVEPIS